MPGHDLALSASVAISGGFCKYPTLFGQVSEANTTSLLPDSYQQIVV